MEKTNHSQKIWVSETFASIQGEGITAGKDSIFLRLKGCNLTCGGKNTLQTKRLDSGATWRCDTIETWTQGTAYPISTLISHWAAKGWLSLLQSGHHLIITGGEPLLQDCALIHFIQALKQACNGRSPYIEIETNGTIKPSDTLTNIISQFNISPKLSNSGMPYNTRIKPDVINEYASRPTSFFKFVIQNEQDIQEAFETIINPANLHHAQVFMMPAASNRKTLHQLNEIILALCQKYRVNYSPRLHIELWDTKTGV